MKLNVNDVVIDVDDAWNKIVIYNIQSIKNGEYILNSSFYSDKHLRTVPATEHHRLLIYPFSFLTREKHEELALLMSLVGDLVCALLDKHGTLTLDKLNGLIIEHKIKYKIRDSADVNWILRCLVAAKRILATHKKDTVSFTLSPNQLARERMRKFSATIATELTSLSERVRSIISHAPSQGDCT